LSASVLYNSSASIDLNGNANLGTLAIYSVNTNSVTLGTESDTYITLDKINGLTFNAYGYGEIAFFSAPTNFYDDVNFHGNVTGIPPQASASWASSSVSSSYSATSSVATKVNVANTAGIGLTYPIVFAEPGVAGINGIYQDASGLTYTDASQVPGFVSAIGTYVGAVQVQATGLSGSLFGTASQAVSASLAKSASYYPAFPASVPSASFASRSISASYSDVSLSASYTATASTVYNPSASIGMDGNGNLGALNFNSSNPTTVTISPIPGDTYITLDHNNGLTFNSVGTGATSFFDAPVNFYTAVNLSSGATGNLTGTSSWANSASVAVSSSWAPDLYVHPSASWASASISASYALSSSNAISASYVPNLYPQAVQVSCSWASASLSASIASTASYITASNVVGTVASASWAPSVTQVSCSWASASLSSSYAFTASYALNSTSGVQVSCSWASSSLSASVSQTSSYSFVAVSASFATTASTLTWMATSSSNNPHTAGVIIVDSITGSYISAFYDYCAASASIQRAGTVMATWDSSGNVEYTDNSTNGLNGDTSDVTLKVAISESHVRLTSDANTYVWSVRANARYL
jgi:Tfp pilus assembly protein PilE